MLSSTHKILYLVHDLSDTTVHKRVLMLKDAGAELIILGFCRDNIPPKVIHGCTSISLGRTYNGKFINRSLLTMKIILTLNRYKTLIKDCNVILARTLEMLAVANRARFMTEKSSVMIYECLDIHRLLLMKNLVGKLFRSTEKNLLKNIDFIITSSPAYIREYFKKNDVYSGPFYLIENKIYEPYPTNSQSQKTLQGAPWKIGWFGAIRCSKSLNILSAVVKKMNGRVELIIRGKPSHDQFVDFDQQVVSTPGISYEGPYKNPTDLEKIYQEVHFNWAIDMFEEGMNSSWLLPNRIYEGGYHQCIPIVQKGLETYSYVNNMGLGVFLDHPIETSLINFFDTLTLEGYLELQNKANSIPRNSWIYDKSDSAALLEYITEVKANYE
jgi:succinoglycan biosynthesis protein ExoL